MTLAQAKLLLQLINIMAEGIALAPSIREAFNKSNDKMKELLDENRDPTPEEWAELNSRIDDLNSELNS